jgi:TRIAP1/MDM35 family protein
LRGNTTSNECEELFTKYKKCLNVSSLSIISLAVLLSLTREFSDIQKVLKERGIDTMLEDARKSSSETDSEFLRKS